MRSPFLTGTGRPLAPVVGIVSRLAVFAFMLAAAIVALLSYFGAAPADGAAAMGGGPGMPAVGRWVIVPPVTTEDLRDVDMVSSALGWAVGENGTVLKYDGTAWQPVDISSTQTLVDVYMVSATNGYIIAWGTAGSDIYHYDGTNWTLQWTAPGSLNRMDGSSASNIWAVGLNLTVHWNGTQWSPVSIPVDRQLFGVIVPSDNEEWAVGQFEPVSMHGLILHNTTGSWAQFPSPAPQTIF
ncbi:MAG: WD40/YVTN/BNR-like repeat-containing protein, partial [Chloroflexia bacterium]